jgi:ribonuclease HII
VNQAGRTERDRALAAFDQDLRAGCGVSLIAGVDEAGRGPLAGPVVAAAVILPADAIVPGADDSKKLRPEVREALFDEIRRVSLAYSWGVVRPATIDRINILEATRMAMRRALAALDPPPEAVLVDGWPVPRLGFRQVALPRADATSLAVACASILAKVHRDRMMVCWDRRYPQYDFAGNKGYGTPAHLSALERHGPCPLHRRSFAPVAQLRIPFSPV